MNHLQIYRKRLLPNECILLKDDIIVEANDEVIITTWKTLNPKTTFNHGSSCYFLKEGIKVSKFYRCDDSLLYWYCDIVDYDFDTLKDTLTVTDLLADVIIHPDGSVKIMDLDELADAMEQGLISNELMSTCLRRLHHLLSLIDCDKFRNLQDRLNKKGL